MTRKLILEYPKKRRYEVEDGESRFGNNDFYWRRHLWSAVALAWILRFMGSTHVTVVDREARDEGRPR